MQNSTKTVIFSILLGLAANAMSINAMDTSANEIHQDNQNQRGLKRKAEVEAVDEVDTDTPIVKIPKSLTGRPYNTIDETCTARELTEHITSFLPPVSQMSTIREMLNYHEMFKQMQFQSGRSTSDEAKFGCFNNKEFVDRLTELVKNDISEDFRNVLYAINPNFWSGIESEWRPTEVEGLTLHQEMYALKAALIDRYCEACNSTHSISDESAEALRYLQAISTDQYRNPSKKPQMSKIIKVVKDNIHHSPNRTKKQKSLLNSLLKSMWTWDYISEEQVNYVSYEDLESFLSSVNILIHYGADVNTKCNGSTLLEKTRNLNLVKLLLDKGANPKLLSKTFLHEELRHRKYTSIIPQENHFLKRIKLLLEAKAFVNEQDKYGDTPLHIAATIHQERSQGIVELLLEHGANPLIKNKNSLTPLQQLQRELWWKGKEFQKEHAEQIRNTEKLLTTAEENVTFLDLLHNKDINIEAQDENGATLLHHAVKNKNYQTICMLLSLRANIEARDNLGYTPLHYAVKNKSERIVNLLLKSGAKIEARDNKGQTPLHCAVLLDVDPVDVDAVDIDALRLETENMINLLLNSGANIEAQDNNGYTPLNTAVSLGKNKDTIILLINKNANINSQDINGNTILRSANSAMHWNRYGRDKIYTDTEMIVDLLKENGAYDNLDAHHNSCIIS